MDTLTEKKKAALYSEAAKMILLNRNNLAIKRMLAAFQKQLVEADTTKEITNMQIVFTSLKYLLEITYTNK